MVNVARILATSIITLALSCNGNSQMIFPGTQEYAQVHSIDRYNNINSAIDSYQSDEYVGNSFTSDTEVDLTLTRGMNNFALNLNKAILTEGRSDNIVLSPLSIFGALSLLLLGSVGQTYNEMANALGYFHEIRDSFNSHRQLGRYIEKLTRKDLFLGDVMKPIISYGSAVFVDNNFPIRQQYENFIKDVYKSMVRHVDFRGKPQEARHVINSWVSELTKGKINNILSNNPSPDSRVILANALYFKAEWEKYFMNELTSRSPFTLDKRNPQNTIKVDMMANVGIYKYYKNDDVTVAGIPYKGNSTFLYAIKPTDATRRNIYQIIQEMTAESLDELIANCKYQSILITFPKMKLTSSNNLRMPLEKLGIRTVFSQASNLALMSPVKQNIQHIKQNAVDSVNDEIIFTRFGGNDDGRFDNCSLLFQNNSLDGTSCTVIEKVNNKTITVIYKKIGDKIGRQVVSGSVRRKRQTGFEEWNPGLSVDEVVHKVDMDITETGTEAAASTLVLITRDGRRPVFAGNEPFFFIIRDEKTKIIIFSTALYKPYPNYG